jgi:hypothetical protein
MRPPLRNHFIEQCEARGIVPTVSVIESLQQNFRIFDSLATRPGQVEVTGKIGSRAPQRCHAPIGQVARRPPTDQPGATRLSPPRAERIRLQWSRTARRVQGSAAIQLSDHTEIAGVFDGRAERPLH